MNVVITGAQGFVGRHLKRELAQHWPTATVVGWDLPAVDITKSATYQDALATIQPDWIVHLAGLAVIGGSDANSAAYQSVNAEGTRQLLAAVAEQVPAAKLLIVSSADVYGGSAAAASGQPVPELLLAQCRPVNVYAASKLKMEQLIAQGYAERVILVRPFPHIGSGQRRGFVTADFASQIAELERRGGGTLQVGNLAAIRDFTDVRDVVRAYRLLMERGATGEVYNVASGHGVVIREVLDQLLALTNATITVDQDPARQRQTDTPVLIGDARKLRAATGWRPTIPLMQSLRDILDHWRSLPSPT